MIRHWTMDDGYPSLDRLKTDFTGLGDVRRIRADARRAILARYCIVAMGVAMLSWLMGHALGLGGGIGLTHAVRVATVAVLGPALVWFASEREVRLLRELEKRSEQLKQRAREISALNRMTQEHLAECFSSPSHQNVVEAGRQVSADGERASWKYVGVVAD